MELRTGRLGRYLVLAVLVLALVVFLVAVRGILLPFFLGLVLAYVVRPLSVYLEGRGLSRVMAIALVYLVLLGLLGLLASYAIPLLLRQLNLLADQLPLYTARLEEWLTGWYHSYRKVDLPQPVRQLIDQSLAGLESRLGAIAGSAVDGLVGSLGWLPALVLAPVLGFYLLRDWDQLAGRLMSAIPVGRRQAVLDLWQELNQILSRFVQGHLLVAVLVGALSGLVVTLLGVRFGLILGVVAGLTELIPYFGPLLGAVPAVAVALLDSPLKALYVALAFLIIQQLEANIISPRIIGGSVGLHPLAVIFALLAGGSLFGILGMLLAVPAAAVLRVLLRRLYLFLAGH